MRDERKKCKGTTKKGRPCEKPPLTGEDYCEKHHPKRLQRKLIKSKVVNLGLILMVISLISGWYLSHKSTKDIQTYMNHKTISLKENFKQHSLAERILNSQYNPIKLGKLLEEVLNLMNIDPNFKKRFHIDGRGINIQIDRPVYEKDFKIDFKTEKAKNAFEEFLKSGRKSHTVDENEYNFYYVLRNGDVVDSFKNETFTLVTDFPKLPLLNISTIDPTGEYLCSNILNIQIDSTAGDYMFISNKSQNLPLKISLRYNLITKRAEFDQLEDIYFDEGSSFYSVDQEISYYELWLALLFNARIRIRNAVTGDSILTTEHFLLVNLLPGKSIENINNKLSVLRTLKKVQDLWGIVFTRSNVTAEEFAYLKGILYSMENSSTVTKYPFRFTLPKDEAKKIISRKHNIEKGSYRIICDKNIINLLDKKLNSGRLVILLPPSNFTYNFHDNIVSFSVSPIKKGDVVVYQFADFSEHIGRPGHVIYSEAILHEQDENFISFVQGIKIRLESWENTKLCEKKINFY